MSCEPCSVPNASAVCDASLSCAMGECNAGWGNCDEDASTGCETPLTTPANCGNCTTVCPSAKVPQIRSPFLCGDGVCRCDPDANVLDGGTTVNESCRITTGSAARCNAEGICQCGASYKTCLRGEYCGYFTQIVSGGTTFTGSRCTCNSTDFGCRANFKCVNNAQCSCDGNASCIVGTAPGAGQAQCGSDGRCVCNGASCPEGQVCTRVGGTGGTANQARCVCGASDYGCDRANTQGSLRCVGGACFCDGDLSCRQTGNNAGNVACIVAGDNAGRCRCGSTVCGPGEHCRANGGNQVCVCGTSNNGCTTSQVCRRGSTGAWGCQTP